MLDGRQLMKDSTRMLTVSLLAVLLAVAGLLSLSAQYRNSDVSNFVPPPSEYGTGIVEEVRCASWEGPYDARGGSNTASSGSISAKCLARWRQKCPWQEMPYGLPGRMMALGMASSLRWEILQRSSGIGDPSKLKLTERQSSSLRPSPWERLPTAEMSGLRKRRMHRPWAYAW